MEAIFGDAVVSRPTSDVVKAGPSSIHATITRAP